jgi:hypothetical protein
MIIALSTRIAAAPDAVWTLVQRPDLLRHIAWPIIRFAPELGNSWPTQFIESEPVPARLFLFGVIPLGVQWIVPSLHQPPHGDWPKRLRDNGHSRLIKRWDHWIILEPDGEGGTRYRDKVDVDAGLLTPIVGLFAHLFYRHRQRRWRNLAKQLPVYRLIWEEQAAFAAARAAGDTDAAWEALKTIHILSQPLLGPHWSSHIAMLRFATEQRDWREVGGQLLRLALVPLGNATGRLPVGNHGRARVSPFLPMPIPEDLRQRLRSVSEEASLLAADHRDTP